jgi:site-specific recombinase XerD
MTRNYGARTRDMSRAGAFFAYRATSSYSSQAALKQRFGKFVTYLKNNGINRLEQVTREIVFDYAKYLNQSDLAAATKQNLLSTVNVIMSVARGDKLVKVTAKEAGLDGRSMVATAYKGSVDRGELSERTKIIVALSRSFGLRFEEASKINAREALSQAVNKYEIYVIAGTKGGQSRTVPIRNADQQLSVLQQAAKIQADAKSMIDPTLSYKEHQMQCYAETSNFHAERHFYANQRYSQLMNEKMGIKINSPVLSDKPQGMRWRDYIAQEASKQGIFIHPDQAREFDCDVRLQISRELGHHREDVVSIYIGGQK